MIEGFTRIQGQSDGPTSVILGGVHGNEVCGVEAIDAILPTLSIEHGTLWVGKANLRAIDQNVRFVDTNLNRMFVDDELLSSAEMEGYEYGRAQEIKSILQEADALLDVHASFTPGARPFAICEPNAKEIVSNLPIDLVVSGFDEVEPGGTDYYMNKLGKIGICIECGYLGDPATTDIAIASIKSFLAVRGHIDQGAPADGQTQEYIRMYKLYKTKVNFSLDHDFEDFERVNEGQTLGTDGEEVVQADQDGIIVFARNRPSASEEAFLLGKYTEQLI